MVHGRRPVGLSAVAAVAVQLGRGGPLLLVLYAALIVFFTFFYAAIVFNPTETADNLKKRGSFIPGIRSGERTAEYIDYVLSRITVIGAIYVSAACVLPELLIRYTGVPLYFRASARFIVVVGMFELLAFRKTLLNHRSSA